MPKQEKKLPKWAKLEMKNDIGRKGTPDEYNLVDVRLKKNVLISIPDITTEDVEIEWIGDLTVVYHFGNITIWCHKVPKLSSHIVVRGKKC